MITARDVFARFAAHAVGRTTEDAWAPDVVIEQPFAMPPSRIEGRSNFLALTEASRESLPVRLEEVRDVVIHETTDPERIVVEYVLAGTVTSTGHTASAPFIAVMEVRDGKIVLWREYQNTLAMAEALGRMPTMDERY